MSLFCMSTKTKAFPLRIDQQLKVHLSALAALQGVSLNAFMQFALETFVAANPLETTRRARSWQVPYVHRNGRCPCGSNEKYRDCHGRRVSRAIEVGKLPADLSKLRQQARTRNERSLPAAPAEQQRSIKLGRNDPCPCGSGVKFKRCCWSQTLIAR